MLHEVEGTREAFICEPEKTAKYKKAKEKIEKKYKFKVEVKTKNEYALGVELRVKNMILKGCTALLWRN